MNFATCLVLEDVIYKHPNGSTFYAPQLTVHVFSAVASAQVATEKALSLAKDMGLTSYITNTRTVPMPKRGDIVRTSHAVNGATDNVVVKVGSDGSILAYDTDYDGLVQLDWWRLL